MMDAVRAEPGRTPRDKDRTQKLIRVPKSPTKYVFKPEVVRKVSPTRQAQTNRNALCRQDATFSPRAQVHHQHEKGARSPCSPESALRTATFRCEGCGETHDRLQHHHRQARCRNRCDSPLDEAHDLLALQDAATRRYLQGPEASGGPPILYRSRSLPQLSIHDSGLGSNEHPPGRPSSRLVADLRQLLTLKQHYYPEGGWGWVILVVGVMVQILSHGIHGASGVILPQVANRFGPRVGLQSGWLGAMSTGVALLVSPVTIAFCRRKSTRVTAVLGGLVTALGCLFTSFASQFHQLFFSYGTVVGIGVGMTRDCSTLMVAQYFKRRREFVEIFIVSGSGLGIAVMSAFIKGAISKIGWRLGLQAVTGVVFLTFILGTFYRSASLYHPQRRAILHLKNQKRKIKDKNKVDDRPPFFDFSTLKSKTVRILLVSTGISAFGINTPIFYLAHQAEEEGLGDTVVLLQAYLGLAWTLGCVAFGLLVVHHSVECRIARQYLTQAAVFMCGLCILALTAVHGNYHGYVMFTWIYGIFCGGYHYSLKMYTYERVRARNFARTWGFVQCSQAIPIAIGVPISGYINVGCGGKAGYYFSSTCVLVGSFTLFFIDLHRRSLSRHKHTRANGTRHLCVADNCPQRKRLSFSQEPENEGVAAGAAAAALMLGAELAPVPGEVPNTMAGEKPELTCISEEGIADMDLPDNLLDDLDYIGDCITSCNKVENYLMLSEFENNLIAEMPIILDRKGRRWSLARSKGPAPGSQGGASQGAPEEEEVKPKWRLMTAPPNNRVITVIDEAST
ncbi:monocarboxylate transporter 10 isoform X1 [Neodiprion pinetum]|uniref:Monocarboxylate transporter 10 isoform X1 n=1 Tax=Neodiprion lecontei TaxID=441921 RepID=A0ABM3GLD2_NEOLC|nr:monocarboxylate transporter 10-like isoform X1 [Neodiprion pinetum]XP_046601081.1 monocarboxylate transporter 10 isoform X1 [Neodiprion lecontei]XP_046627715.1 monocarboxylate transporter 10-like isoform X1 [Neodiprion virginianus]